MKSQFQKLKDYINNNKAIKRQDILKLGNQITIDTYRAKLVGHGFLKGEGYGTYIRLLKIPDNFTARDVNNYYSI